MPYATIVVPAFNVEKTLAETLDALLAQTLTDFEIIIVNDGSWDDTRLVAKSYLSDLRVRLVNQRNRGLAGARNTGIAAAEGDLIGFCDADDIWEPNKLATHVLHLDASPDVGISYSGSSLIDDNSKSMKRSQSPRLKNIYSQHIFKRNPIGNGSAPVIRKSVFDAIAYRPAYETERDWYFDETFRQSEDIECWTRIVLTTTWEFEGVPGNLTRYRINSGGLSANIERQLTSWENMIRKLKPINPGFFAKHEAAARAYQYRYLARRAVSDLDGDRAYELFFKSVSYSFRPIFEEPIKTIQTMLAAVVLKLVGQETLRPFLAGKGNIK
jgi:glycosyltransferase involved in cell wall biosynthesis